MAGAAVAGTMALVAGILLLRAANRGLWGAPGLARAGGWALVVAGFALWCVGSGTDRALPLGALAFSLAGYGIVIIGVQVRARHRRDRKPPDGNEPPPVRPRSPWRTAARIVLAGPLSLIFGLAVAVVLSIWTPVAEVNAVMLGALLGPVAFAAATAWSLAYARLVRVGPGPKMSGGFVQRMLAGHSALGLTLGGLIYLICLTGTLDVFVADLRNWEQPRDPVTVSARFIDTALAEARQRVGAGGYVYLLLPAMEAGRARLEVGAGAHETRYAVDAQGHVGGELHTPFTDFLDRTHMYLCLPQTAGLLIVGLLGVALLSLLISGVLAHPRIFRDAFRLRWGGSRRLQEADLHNRLSVWGLPFHIAVVLTGAFFGLSNLLALAISTAAYHGDVNHIFGLLGDRSVAADSRPAPMPAIGPMLKQLGVAEHLERVNYIGVENIGTAGALVSFEIAEPGRLMRGEREFFDAQGRYLGAAGYADGPGGKQVYAAAASLHFGSFGGLPVRLAYGVLGLALCVVSASGVSIWAARRRDQGRPAPRAQKLWLGTVWGVPAALAVSGAAALIAPLSPLPVFWSALSATAVLALTRRSTRQASRAARLVLAGALVAVAGIHLERFAGRPQTDGLVIDGACLLGAIWLLAVWHRDADARGLLRQ